MNGRSLYLEVLGLASTPGNFYALRIRLAM